MSYTAGSILFVQLKSIGSTDIAKITVAISCKYLQKRTNVPPPSSAPHMMMIPVGTKMIQEIAARA